MKKTLYLLCLILLSQTLFAQEMPENPTLVSDLESSGELKLKDGKPYSGEAYFLNEEGLPFTMNSYVNGKKEGLWRLWHRNGNLHMEGSKVDGIKDGQHKEYFENGKLKLEEHYDLGKKVGKWLEYRSDGSLFSEVNFRDDIKHGKSIIYQEDGTERMTEVFENGRKISSDRFKTSGGVNITTTRTPREAK